MTLHDFLSERRMSNTAFAAMIRKSPSFVSRMRRGDAFPSVETLALIERVTDRRVMASDFARREGFTRRRAA